jgi:hypothetical protein
MNNNMIKVLGVVVIAAGLWWVLKSDGDPYAGLNEKDCAAYKDGDKAAPGDWTKGKCSDDKGTDKKSCEAIDKAKWTEGTCAAPKKDAKKDDKKDEKKEEKKAL